MNKLQALKNKKGFTLVEIIVVLVILAILAAFGIPSMIGFIDDARGKALLADARSTYTAFQILLTEDSMVNPPNISATAATHASIAAATNGSTTTNDAAYIKRVTDLLAPDIKYDDGDTVPAFRVDKGQVLGLVYAKGNSAIAFVSGQPAQDFTGTDAADKAKAALNTMLGL